jgi:hypothetical protein
VRRFPAALLCLLAVSCVPSKRRDVDSPSDLGSGEVLLIGRIKLTPPIAKDEQVLSSVAEEWRGRVMVIIGDTFTPLERPFKVSGYKNRIEAPPDREFSVAVPANSFSIRGGVVPLRLHTPPSDEALLPGGFQVEVRPGDTALYIGTIHYHRDEFWQITKVEVEDDYDRVRTDCLRRWARPPPSGNRSSPFPRKRTSTSLPDFSNPRGSACV